MEKMKIKDWFLEKMEIPRGFFVSKNAPVEIIKETEKAVQVIMDIISLDGEYETVHRAWVPKSCIESLEEYEKAQEKREEDYLKKFEEGKKKHDEVLEFAKSKNIKGVRKNLKTVTLLEMIKAAGFEYTI